MSEKRRFLPLVYLRSEAQNYSWSQQTIQTCRLMMKRTTETVVARIIEVMLIARLNTMFFDAPTLTATTPLLKAPKDALNTS